MMPVAIAFSMIVEMTSLTPRVTLSTPAMPAQSAPTTIATTTMTGCAAAPGSATRRRPTAAASTPRAVLAVDADVEQVHPEADGDREGRRGSTIVAVLSDQRDGLRGCGADSPTIVLRRSSMTGSTGARAGPGR